MLTQERLKTLFFYYPLAGTFRNLKTGKLSDAERTMVIEGQRFPCARLAWLYEHGILPDLKINHKNKDATDNRIKNLELIKPSKKLRHALAVKLTKNHY